MVSAAPSAAPSSRSAAAVRALQVKPNAATIARVLYRVTPPYQRTPYDVAERMLGRKLTAAERSAFRETWDRLTGKPPLGSGQRFAALTEKLARRGAANPKALAAYIGRKTYGPKRFQGMAAAGAMRRKG